MYEVSDKSPIIYINMKQSTVLFFGKGFPETETMEDIYGIRTRGRFTELEFHNICFINIQNNVYV